MNVFTGLLLRTVLCLLAVLGCGLLVPYRLLAEEAQGTTPAVATPEVPAASPKNDGKKDAKKKPKATAADAALTSEEGAPASDPGVPAAGKKAKRGDLQSSGVTEVVVTAQKRKQRAQEVPISIGVLNDQFIKDSGLTDVRNLQEYVPNLQVQPTTDSRSTTIRIRGIGTPGNNAGLDPSVGTFVDGVYQGRPGMSLSDLLDVERVEVLRGPQGTLYGKNTVAGALNVISKKPRFKYEGELEGLWGTFNAFEGRGTVNVPLWKDRIAARLSAYSVTRGGYDSNPSTRQRFNDADKYGFKLRTLFNVTPDLEVLLTADHAHEDTACCAPDLITDKGFPALGLRFSDFEQVTGRRQRPIDPFDRHIDSDEPTRNKVSSGGLGAEINWHVFDHTLTSITAYRRFTSDSSFDGDFSQYKSVFANTNENFLQWSSELRLASPSGRAFEYVLGAYWFHSRDNTNNVTGIGPDFIRTASTAALTRYSLETRNLIHALGEVLASSQDALGRVYNTDFNVHKTTTAAAFGQGTYKFNDQWSLTSGLRVMWERKARVGTQKSAFKIDTGIFGPDLQADESRAVVNVAPMASLRYFPGPDKMIFLTGARGFKSGGFNQLRTVGGLHTEFNDEEATDFELGTKTQWFNRRLTANGTFFYSMFDNFQAQSFDGSSITIRNAGSLNSWGFEGDLVAVLHPNLLLGHSFGFNRATYNKFDSAQCTVGQQFNGHGTFPGTKGNPFVKNNCVQDLQGKPLDNAPEWTLSTWLQYERSLPIPHYELMGFMRGEWSYRDRFNLAQDLDPGTVQDPVNLFNLRTGIHDPDDRWEVTVWAHNVTNEQYHVVAFDIPLHSGFAGVVAPPRTYGVTVRLTF